MQPVGGGPVKIGYSENVDRRRIQLEARYKTQLVVLSILEGDQDEEARIHARFAHVRLGGTEQFQPSPDLMAFIGCPDLAHVHHELIEPMAYEDKPLIALKCRQAYKDWVADFAKLKRTTPSQLIDQALVAFAETEGHVPPPER